MTIVFHNKRVLMFNAFGILSISAYLYTVLHNWIVLNVVPTQPADLVFWVLGGLFLLIKVYGYAIRASDQKRRQRHEAEMDKLDLEMKKLDLEQKKRSVARGKDYDENQIT